jgi:hypothetical protein
MGSEKRRWQGEEGDDVVATSGEDFGWAVVFYHVYFIRKR